MRLRKGAVKGGTVGGIERHREVLLRKAGLGSVRLAYFIVFSHWEPLLKAEQGLGEAVEFLKVLVLGVKSVGLTQPFTAKKRG